jgi:YbbR domain-containing protein
LTTPFSKSRIPYKSGLLVLVILALLLGAGLLFYAEQSEITLAVPVTFEHIGHDLIAFHNIPVLEARLKGPSRVLKALKDRQLSYKIDLSGAKPGPLFIKISPEMIKVPRRVSVIQIDPASFTITIDKRMEKIVPIVADLNKDPAPVYIISRVVTVPSMVRLAGPMSVLDKISAVRTTPVDVGGLTETIKKKVALNLNHNPHVQAIGDSLVEVEIVVEEKTVEKWLNIAIRATGSHYRYVITPDHIEILLRGPMNTLRELAQDNGIQVYVDLEGLEPGTYVRRAIIKPPLNTALVKSKPEVFTVKIFKSG